MDRVVRGSVVAFWLGIIAGCGLSTSGGAPKAAPCTTLAHCDDANLCTNDSCTESGTCESKPAPDGAPLEQIPGDCKQVACSGGEEAATPDDADSDDDNPCTTDTCEEGVANHVPVADGTECDVGASKGACVKGKCVVACNGGDECDDGEPCTADACDLETKTCVFDGAALDGMTPRGVEDADDCIDEVCLGGKATTVADDDEVPDDGNPCTTDACDGGTAEHSALAPGSACQGDHYCDEAAQCVECLQAAHCGNDPCFDHACNMGSCSSTPKPAMTPLPDATGNGDCMGSACDGNGNAVEVLDAGDTPSGDGNDCTKEECVGGSPMHTPQHGASCNDGGGSICNQSTCVECLTNAQCNAPDTCGGGGTQNECGCTPESMAATCSGKCMTVQNNCGQNVSCGNCASGLICNAQHQCVCPGPTCCNGTEDGAETDVDCGGGTCFKCANGKKCDSGSDCLSGSCNPGLGKCM